MERRLLKKTDYMVVTAQRFFDKYQDSVKNISLIPNAVDIKTVAIKQRKDRNESSHVFGYVGMISEWFDFRALEVIAEQENITVDLVGPCNVAKYNKENVVYEGKIPKDMVGQKIQSFDVCLYPFKNGKLLDTVNPVKIYEYLAENKPVIAVDSVETRKFGNLIYRYRDYEELRKLCNTQLRKPFQTDEECMKYIENNSWEKECVNLKNIGGNSMMKVMSVFGTRPEAIKMCPLVLEMEKHPEIESVVCLTGQHREMLDQVMQIFGIKAQYDLNIMRPKQTLTTITTSVLEKMEDVLMKEKPDIVLVHGDTTTSFVVALAAFYQQIPVGHVEAGLRTYNKYSPFPEEMNRNLTGKIAELHFAPTVNNKNNLAKENITENVFVTGNTVIDAFKTTVKQNYQYKEPELQKINLDGKDVF